MESWKGRGIFICKYAASIRDESRNSTIDDSPTKYVENMVSFRSSSFPLLFFFLSFLHRFISKVSAMHSKRGSLPGEKSLVIRLPVSVLSVSFKTSLVIVCRTPWEQAKDARVSSTTLSTSSLGKTDKLIASWLETCRWHFPLRDNAAMIIADVWEKKERKLRQEITLLSIRVSATFVQEDYFSESENRTYTGLRNPSSSNSLSEIFRWTILDRCLNKKREYVSKNRGVVETQLIWEITERRTRIKCKIPTLTIEESRGHFGHAAHQLEHLTRKRKVGNRVHYPGEKVKWIIFSDGGCLHRLVRGPL